MFDNLTGELQTNKELDREKEDRYMLVIQAKDSKLCLFCFHTVCFGMNGLTGGRIDNDTNRPIARP